MEFPSNSSRLPIFWSYLRWSTPPQEFGDSERRQIEPGKAWAAARGIEHVDNYRDPGVSAWSGKNLKAALGRFITDLNSRDPERPQPGDFLGVESIDRLSRSKHTLDAAELVNTLFKKNITLIIHTMADLEMNRQIVSQKPYLVDLLIRELQRGSAESSLKSDRVRQAKQQRRDRGRETGAPITGESCPGWLVLVGADKRTREPGHYELDLERAAIVKQIFQWAASGLGGAVIAGRLNRAGIAPFRKVGPKMSARIANGNAPKWHPNIIRLLLSNRAVIGYVQPCRYIDGRRVHDGPEQKLYPAVIDESLFEKVQLIAESRKGHKGAGRKGDYANLFTGLCKCQECGKGVVLRHQKGKQAYLCCEMARHRSCTNHVYFPYKVLEKFVFENHMRLWNIEKMLVKLTPESEDIPSQIPKLENELATLRMERGRLVKRFAKGDPDADELLADYDRQIPEKEKELAALRHDDLIARHGNDFYERWNQAREILATGSPDARAKLSTLLRERIIAVTLTPRRTLLLDVSNGRRNSAIIRLEITAALGVNLLTDHDSYFDIWCEWQRLENPHNKNIEIWNTIR